MLKVESSYKNNRLLPMLTKGKLESYYYGLPRPGSQFGKGIRLTFFCVEIKNEQTDVTKIAQNVRAQLDYKHSKNEFSLSPACLLYTNSRHENFVDDSTDIDPGEKERIVLAVTRKPISGKGIIDSYAATVVWQDQNILKPVQLLEFGKWEIRVSVRVDNFAPIEFSLMFHITETGDLANFCFSDIEYSNPAEAPISTTSTHEAISIPSSRTDPVAAERSKLLQEYKNAGREKGIKITDKMIAEKARPTWHERTPVQRWKKNNPRCTSGDDAAILRVLKNKPHLL